MPRKLTKILSFFLCFLLIFEQSGFAQVAGELDISGHLLQLRNSFLQDKFRPLHLRYLSYDSLNNNFKLLLDKGDFNKGLSPKGTDPKTKGTLPEEKLQEETRTLLNYFFIGVSLPNSSFWVNLRPDSADQIIDDALAQTDVGKILLEADLQLKKDTAKATSPETPEGREYWDKLYKKAEELFGQNNITIPTLTRPWIVPDEIIIRETPENAYVYKATLKVMLEEDYLRQSLYSFKDERLKTLNEYSSQLLRELIIPKLTKEINTAKRYAPLRQVYYSLILAQWFKSRFYGKSGLYSWLIDRKNLNGLTSPTPWSKTTYFKEYQKSFQQGEYNLKEPVYTPFGQTIRSYMSGGIAFGENIAASVVAGTLQGGSREMEGIINSRPSSSPIIAASIRGGNAEEPYLGIGIEATEPAIKPPEIKEKTSSPLAESEKPSALSEVGERNSGLERRDVLKVLAIMAALGLWPSLGHGAQKDIYTLIRETADEIGRLQENESQLANQKLTNLLTNQSFIPLKHQDKLYAYYSIGKRLEAKGNIPRAIDTYHFYLQLPVYTSGYYEDEIYYRLNNLYKQAPNYAKTLSLLYHGATSLGAPYDVVSDHHFGVLYGPEEQGVTIVLYDDHHDAFPRGHVFPKGPLTFEWVKKYLHIGGWIAPLAKKGSVVRLVWIHEGGTSEKRTFWQMAFKEEKGVEEERVLENASSTEQADVYLPVHRIDGISNLDSRADYLKGKVMIHIDLDIFAEAFREGEVNAKLDALIRQIQTKFKPEQILSIVIATSPSHSSLGANRERINALRDALIQALVKPPAPPNRPYGVAPVTDEKIREAARFVGLDPKAGNKAVLDAIRQEINTDPRANLERVVKDKWPIKTSPSASSPLIRHSSILKNTLVTLALLLSTIGPMSTVTSMAETGKTTNGVSLIAAKGEVVEHISGAKYPFQGRIDGDYPPSSQDSLFKSMANAKGGATGGFGNELTPKDITYTLGMFTEQADAQDVENLIQQYQGKIQQDPRLLRALQEIIKDKRIFIAFQVFLRDGGRIGAWPSSGRYNHITQTISIGMDGDDLKRQKTSLHETLHYINDKIDSVLWESGADHFLISPLEERFLIIQLIREGRLPLDKRINSLDGYTTRGKLGEKIEALLTQRDLKGIENLLTSEEAYLNYVHSGMVSPLSSVEYTTSARYFTLELSNNQTLRFREDKRIASPDTVKIENYDGHIYIEVATKDIKKFAVDKLFATGAIPKKDEERVTDFIEAHRQDPDKSRGYILTPEQTQDIAYLYAYNANILFSSLRLAGVLAQRSGKTIEEVYLSPEYKVIFLRFLKEFSDKIQHNPQLRLRETANRIIDDLLGKGSSSFIETPSQATSSSPLAEPAAYSPLAEPDERGASSPSGGPLIVSLDSPKEISSLLGPAKQEFLKAGQKVQIKRSDETNWESGIGTIVRHPTSGAIAVRRKSNNELLPITAIISLYGAKAQRRRRPDGTEVVILYRAFNNGDKQLPNLIRQNGILSAGLNTFRGDRAKLLSTIKEMRSDIDPSDITSLLDMTWDASVVDENGRNLSPLMSFTADPLFAERLFLATDNIFIEIEIPVSEVLEIEGEDKDQAHQKVIETLRQPLPNKHYLFVRAPFLYESEYTSLADQIPPQYIKRIYHRAYPGASSSPLEDRKTSPTQESKNASSLISESVTSNKGGIDLRALPIVTQPMPGDLIQGQSPKNILGSVPLGRSENALAGTDPISMNLDAEWQQIENMTQAGLIPSNERIKEYLEVSCQSQDCSQRIDKVLSLLADILRLEEERVSSTEPALREMLVLLESDKSAQELQVAISKIEVSPKEPQTIEQ